MKVDPRSIFLIRLSEKLPYSSRSACFNGRRSRRAGSIWAVLRSTSHEERRGRYSEWSCRNHTYHEMFHGEPLSGLHILGWHNRRVQDRGQQRASFVFKHISFVDRTINGKV